MRFGNKSWLKFIHKCYLFRNHERCNRGRYRRNSSNWILPFDYKWNADFDGVKNYVKKITVTALENGIPPNIVLNVNFPKLKSNQINGIKFADKQKQGGLKNSIKEPIQWV